MSDLPPAAETGRMVEAVKQRKRDRKAAHPADSAEALLREAADSAGWLRLEDALAALQSRQPADVQPPDDWPEWAKRAVRDANKRAAAEGPTAQGEGSTEGSSTDAP